jgi:hypothetical protein
VVFATNQITKTENFVAYKLQNFIADVGGLLGLFLGSSLLSLVELLYGCIPSIKKCSSQRVSSKKELLPRFVSESEENKRRRMKNVFLVKHQGVGKDSDTFKRHH